MALLQTRTLAARCPRALAANKVTGRGPFAVLSCPEADGIRRVYLFENATERNRMLWRFDRTGRCHCEGAECKQDHVILDFEE